MSKAGKYAIVTGGSSGIGSSMVERLQLAGTRVAILGLEWVTGQVLAADGGVSLFSPIDLEDFVPNADSDARWLAGAGVYDA